MKSVLVHDVLASKAKQEVSCIEMDATVINALALMAKENIGALVVTDTKGNMSGIFSERDYARKVALKGQSSQEMAVKEIMTPIENTFIVKPEMTVEDCMVLMTAKHVRHLPVFSDGKFVGLVSIGDIVKSVISKQEFLIEQLSNYIAGKY